jgi:hypothetical protein
LRRFTLTVVVLVAAALIIVPAGASATTGHAAGFKGSGKTSQNGRILLNLSSSGKKIIVTTEYRVSCDSGASYTDTVRLSGPAHPGGFQGHHLSRVKFDFTNTDSGQIQDSSGNVLNANLEVEVAGNIRLDTGNAKGTIQPTLTLSNGDKCTSGNTPITYSASF